MQIQFLGANKQVTGSRYLLQAAGLNILIDCGMFQERKFLHRNWDQPPFAPENIDYMLLTHAHLDHSGLIPRLVTQGFSAPIITVEPTAPIAEIIMLDSAKIQAEDAAYKAKRHRKEKRKSPHPTIPLYTTEDAQQAVSLFRTVKYNQPFKLNDHAQVTFHNAGHILGSAFLEITATEDNQTRRIVFSGDIGQPDKPLIDDPTPLPHADALVMESTYGDRNHRDSGLIDQQLSDIINRTTKRGGNVVIPTFAVERAQELIYHICQLRDQDKIPQLTVFLDSPMAVNVTNVFRQFGNYLNQNHPNCIDHVCKALKFPGLKLVRTTAESIAINNHKGPAVILASSGMCTGGRVKHHLRQNIANPNATIIFVGYQAEGTLGRHILNQPRTVRIHGQHWPLRADIQQIYGFSAHGDQQDLLNWLSTAKPKQIFLTHGEPNAASKLAKTIQQIHNLNPTIPDFQDTHQIQ